MNLKETLDKAALALGLFLMFGILFIPERIPELRIGVENLVGLLLNPLLNEPIKLPFHMILFILATLTGLYASWIQKYTMDWKLMKRVQERMKAFQKEFKEAQLSGNAQKLKKLEAQRNEMMADQLAMTKQQFKPMLYISIISIPLFMWAYSAIIPSYLFSWDEVPGNNNDKLISFFEKNLGAEWAKKATIMKINDGRVITISDGKNSYSLALNEEKTKAILKTDDFITYEFPVKIENGKLNIYTPEYSMIFPFWGEQKLSGIVFWVLQYWIYWYFICSLPVSQIIRKSLNIGM